MIYPPNYFAYVLEAQADAQSLIPDAVALQDGHLEIFDAEGNLVSTLRITGEGLERWLEDAPARLAEANLVTAEDEAMLAGLGYATGDDDGSKLIDLEDVRERLAPWLE